MRWQAPEERFDSKYLAEPNSGCWLWEGFCDKDGYGRFWTGTTTRFAHRFSYERNFGQVQAGLDLDHLCGVRCCVNPGHLQPVDHAENVRRGKGGPGLQRKKLSHCRRGHSYDQENTYRYGTERFCRECRRMNVREQMAKKRAEVRLQGVN